MINPKLLKSVLACLLVAVTTYTVHAQEVSRKENLKSLTSITVSSGIDIFLTQGSEDKVEVKGSKELMERLILTEENSGNLVLKLKPGSKNNNWGNNNSIKAYITFKDLNSIQSSGGSDISGENTFKLDALSLSSSGGSDVKLSLDVINLYINMSGGSDVSVKGTATDAKIVASGGSDLSASGLIIQNLDGSFSGGSDGDINVVANMLLSASGASDVRYSGNPKSKKISKSGASDVTAD